MNQMYEAMKKLADSNPDFAKTFEKAQKDRKERIAQEAEESRKRNAAAYQAKIKREAEDAQRKENERRQKEIEIMSTKLPFCYNYAHFGIYSSCCGIVFAHDADEARSIMIDAINNEFLDNGTKTINDLGEYEKEYYERALKTLYVAQADFSKGIYCCGSWIE
ncbi:MAG: hypothetical protein NC548_12975 [Lachnospiraceae bacterium]|nr:hypothetical protein [Lachnospiraceae bacterium]MCM1230696.1 hypothetical protein [Ruminococcus flavefaciens]